MLLKIILFTKTKIIKRIQILILNDTHKCNRQLRIVGKACTFYVGQASGVDHRVAMPLDGVQQPEAIHQ